MPPQCCFPNFSKRHHSFLPSQNMTPCPTYMSVKSSRDPSSKYALDPFTSPLCYCCHWGQAMWLLAWVTFRASSTMLQFILYIAAMRSFKHVNQSYNSLASCWLVIKSSSLPMGLSFPTSLSMSPITFTLFIKLQADWKFQRNVRLVLASQLFLRLLPRNAHPLAWSGSFWILIKQWARGTVQFWYPEAQTWERVEQGLGVRWDLCYGWWKASIEKGATLI